MRRRLQRVLARFSDQPEGSVPLACPGSPEMHGAYRFFQNKAVSPSLLLGGHQAATLARMSACTRVLCVGDTTFLNYPKQRAITGLGPHSNPTEHGLLLHPLVAFSQEGVRLGTLHWQSWARDPAFGKRKGHDARPIEQKESRRWGEELRSLDQWRTMLPETHLLYVADRESDIYGRSGGVRPWFVNDFLNGIDKKSLLSEAVLPVFSRSASQASDAPLRSRARTVGSGTRWRWR